MGRRTFPAWLEMSPTAAAGLIIIAVLASFCFAGPLFYHPDLTRVNLLNGNHPPGAGHLLGTDANGLDILGLLMTGGQRSLEVGIAAGLLSAVIGAAWGAVAGYVGRAFDAVMMRVVDAAFAIPTLVLLLLLSAIYTPSPAALIVVIAATSWLSTAHLVRGAALTLRSREFVQAVRSMGGGRVRTIARHIAPNAVGVILVSVTVQVADAILVLATLSYLGLGIRPPSPDWGNMIASGIQYISNGYWWEIYPAGIAIILAVVAFNLLGDGLNDRFEAPRPIR
ncbi:MAG TPA: ABC transporter permease [Streptosporangiaceae bacterium]|jgi:peptide/nickel transport system permease protein|nr:ABC transporter permease [Streptosporangiaceae bacterium]